MMPAEQRIAYFISPHGYGHAARAAAIMAAMQELEPTIRFEIFTRVPYYFFEASLSGPFGYQALLTDIGVAQKSSLIEDLSETVRRLEQFLPFDPLQIKNLAQRLTELKCGLVMCDIVPLGIAVAAAAAIPSILVENFTWDWIYEGYVQYEAGLKRYVAYLREVFEAVDYHIQTEPVCRPHPADLVITSPISRKSRTPARQTRQKLGIPDRAKTVLITLGGIRGRYAFLEQLKNQPDIYFVIPGGSEQIQIQDNLLLLPHHSDFFHPDLINAADVVVGKVGYSTLAEVYHAGIPFGHVARQKFPESKPLENYIEAHMSGLPISEAQFRTAVGYRCYPTCWPYPTSTAPALTEQTRQPILSGNW